MRPPTKANSTYRPYAVSAWPSWDVPVGNLTTHGAQLMTLMGTYYNAYFAQQGLLRGSGADAANLVYFYSDNAERTYATAQSLAAGMFPSNPPVVNQFFPATNSDPLFYPVKTNLGPPDYNAAAAALAGRIGFNASALSSAYQLQFSLLESALLNQPDPAPVSWGSPAASIRPPR